MIQELHEKGVYLGEIAERLGGRPAMTAADPRVAAARRLHQDRSMSIDEICSTLGISRPTFYRYLAL